MLSAISVQNQFQASTDLLRGRHDAVRRFDTSIDGFWASFQIVVIAAIPYLLIVLAEYRLESEMSPIRELGGISTSFFISRFVGLPLEWVAFPLLMIPLARWMSLEKRYVPYVVIRNWTNLPPMVAYAACALLYLAGVVGEEGFMLISLIAFAIAIRLKWLALRLALGTDVAVSLALLIIDFLLSILLLFFLDALMGVR